MALKQKTKFSSREIFSHLRPSSRASVDNVLSSVVTWEDPVLCHVIVAVHRVRHLPIRLLMGHTPNAYIVAKLSYRVAGSNKYVTQEFESDVVWAREHPVFDFNIVAVTSLEDIKLKLTVKDYIKNLPRDPSLGTLTLPIEVSTSVNVGPVRKWVTLTAEQAGAAATLRGVFSSVVQGIHRRGVKSVALAESNTNSAEMDNGSDDAGDSKGDRDLRAPTAKDLKETALANKVATGKGVLRGLANKWKQKVDAKVTSARRSIHGDVTAVDADSVVPDHADGQGQGAGDSRDSLAVAGSPRRLSAGSDTAYLDASAAPGTTAARMRFRRKSKSEDKDTNSANDSDDETREMDMELSVLAVPSHAPSNPVPVVGVVEIFIEGCIGSLDLSSIPACFVVLKCERRWVRTAMQRTKTPSWGELISFPVTEPGAALGVALCNNNFIGADGQLLGQTMINVSSLAPGVLYNLAIPLIKRSSTKTRHSMSNDATVSLGGAVSQEPELATPVAVSPPSSPAKPKPKIPMPASRSSNEGVSACGVPGTPPVTPGRGWVVTTNDGMNEEDAVPPSSGATAPAALYGPQKPLPKLPPSSATSTSSKTPPTGATATLNPVAAASFHGDIFSSAPSEVAQDASLSSKDKKAVLALAPVFPKEKEKNCHNPDVALYSTHKGVRRVIIPPKHRAIGTLQCYIRLRTWGSMDVPILPYRTPVTELVATGKLASLPVVQDIVTSPPTSEVLASAKPLILAYVRPPRITISGSKLMVAHIMELAAAHRQAILEAAVASSFGISKQVADIVTQQPTSAPFSPPTFHRELRRIKYMAQPVLRFVKRFGKICTWEQPIFSLSANIIWVILMYSLPYVPVIITAALFGFLVASALRRFENAFILPDPIIPFAVLSRGGAVEDGDSLAIRYVPELSTEFEDGAADVIDVDAHRAFYKSEEETSIRLEASSLRQLQRKYQNLKFIAGRLQDILGNIADFMERGHALWKFDAPVISYLVLAAVFAAFWATFLLPFWFILAFGGCFVMRHPRFRSPHTPPPVNMYLRLPTLRSRIVS